MPSNSFQDFASQQTPVITDWLNGYLQQAGAAYDSTGGYADLLHEIQVLISRGGKRLRPLLCLLAYDGYGGNDEQYILPIAGATELLHSFLLMHDDIIDRDDQRWGGLNIYGVYKQQYDEHYALSQALLAGDICYNLALQALPTLALQRRCLDVTNQVLSGELNDVRYSLTAATPTSEQVTAMYLQKTASYSFVLPLQLGAMAAGANDAELTLLQRLGEQLGLAYQLQDDLLGIYGDPAKTSKSNVSDLREGKQTLLVVAALERATAEDAAKLRSLLGSATVGDAELQQAQTIITNSGAKQYVDDTITHYHEQARATLERLLLQPAARQQLIDLIAMLQQRNN